MKNDIAIKLKKIIGKRGILFYLLIALSVLQSALSVGLAICIKMLVNAYEYDMGGEKITGYAIVLIAVVLSSFLVGLLIKLISAKYTAGVERALKVNVFKSFISNGYLKLKNNQGGEVISKLSTDAGRVANVYANLFYSFIATVVHLIAIICALLILQPTFTLIVLALGAVAMAVTYFVRKLLLKQFKRVREKDGEVVAYLNEVNKNSLIIKAFSAEDYASNEFSSKVDSYKRFKQNHLNLGAVVSSATALAFALLYAVSVIVAIGGMSNGVASLDFGVLIAVLQLITQIKSPINNLVNYVTINSEMQISAKRLFTLLSEEQAKKSSYEGGFEGVEIKNLTFTYGNEPILSNLSLTVNKGDKIVINGVSGEGKSTLLKIIMGLYGDYEGEVNLIVNGKKISPENLRGVYSLSLQDSMLFSGTVLDNVSFDGNYSKGEVLNALSLACVDFISQGASGLNEVIKEDGSNLSVGQGQRIALARALVSKAPVLILDEATSALDGATEEKALKNLSLDSERTVIFVSHKDTFNKYANKVYKLKDGSLTAL